MSNIPKPQTKSEYIADEREKYGEEAIAFELMFALAGARGTYTNKPTYNEQSEVHRKSTADIRNLDFSDMGDYIDSLVQIADHWQEYAEHYYDELKALGVTFDEQGYVDYVPDVVDNKEQS